MSVNTLNMWPIELIAFTLAAKKVRTKPRGRCWRCELHFVDFQNISAI